MQGSPLCYLKNLSQDKYVASVFPTSKYGVNKVCEKIDFSECRLIVEYGPATGVFSNFLLEKMPEDAKLVLIERNENFTSILKASIQDPRVMVFNDSAENITNIIQEHYSDLEVDYIISGIPFTFLTVTLRKEIVSKSWQVLKKNGKFLAYQTFYQKDAHLKNILSQYYKAVRDQYEILNIPPMRIYEAIK